MGIYRRVQLQSCADWAFNAKVDFSSRESGAVKSVGLTVESRLSVPHLLRAQKTAQTSFSDTPFHKPPLVQRPTLRWWRFVSHQLEHSTCMGVFFQGDPAKWLFSVLGVPLKPQKRSNRVLSKRDAHVLHPSAQTRVRQGHPPEVPLGALRVPD